MSTKRERAQQAARLGIDVFPVMPNAKMPPLITDWPNQATRDPKQIDAWWDEWPDANIGGSMRDKLVFDVDKRNGGWDTWGALLAIEHFPKTRGSTTAGGGAHLIYQMPEGEKVTNGTHKAGQGIDIKGCGGYIVLPGSTINGNKYEWDNDLPVTLAPAWAIERYKNAKERTAAAGKRVVEEDDIAIELFTNWIRDHAPRAELGEIDDTTFKVAARGYDFACSEPTVIELTSGWNETHCDGLGDAERLITVCESAGRNRDRPIGCDHPAAPGFEPVEIDESKRPKAATEPSLPRPRLYTIRADEAARVALEKRGEPLIRGIIDRGTMSVLVGKGGGGKTFLALDWSYHIAKGREWAGKRVKHGAVVYLAAEAGNMILSRLKALEQHYGPLGDAPLFVIPCPANFSRGPEDVKAILELIRDVEKQCGQKVELFVVDTLARVMTGDENSAKDMGVIIEAVDFIRQQIGCHGMLIHHPNKAGTSARGSGNVFGGTDTEMWVDEHKVLSFTKQRDMPLGKDIRFKLKPLQLGTDADGEPITSCVVHVSKAGEVEPMGDLTPRLLDVWTLLSAALEDAGRTTFDMAFLKQIPFRHSSDTALKRTTLATWMSELSESGYLRKDTYGQWVTVSVESVENCRNENSQKVSDSPTPERRGTAHRPTLQKRKRAKRSAG